MKSQSLESEKYIPSAFQAKVIKEPGIAHWWTSFLYTLPYYINFAILFQRKSLTVFLL